MEPIGTLVLHAAWLDNELIEFLALLLPFCADTTAEGVAHKMRNWNDSFLASTVAGSGIEPELAADLLAYFRRIKDLRDRRHRVIHDAMEVGIEEKPDGGYDVVLLRDGFVRDGKRTDRTYGTISVELIAAMAAEFYDRRLEIDTFRGRLYDSGGTPSKQGALPLP